MNYQFTSRQLTLDNLSRSNQGHMTFKRLHLLNGASSYQVLHETHLVNHYMVFQFTPLNLKQAGILMKLMLFSCKQKWYTYICSLCPSTNLYIYIISYAHLDTHKEGISIWSIYYVVLIIMLTIRGMFFILFPLLNVLISECYFHFWTGCV